MRLMVPQRWCAVLMLCMMGVTKAESAIFSFLDYDNFEDRLAEATTAASVSAFNSTEVDLIKSNIFSSLSIAYADFDITFTETNIGGDLETLRFGNTGGGFGVANGIDWRNQRNNEAADIFTANFDGFIESFESRAQQISEFSAALAGTAAHELGHNLGLRHQDAYGDVTFTGTAINTGGIQDIAIMATGSTGLSETQREIQRTFTDHTKVKLMYGELLSNSTPSSVAEASGDAGNTAAAAQVLTLTDITVANRRAVNVIASHLNATDTDFYSVDLEAGSTLTVDINNELFGSNPFLRVFDTNGTLIASNDDTIFSGDAFGSGSTRADDALLFNIPVAMTGSYVIEVDNLNNGGDYDLLVHTDAVAVPEPANIAWAVLGIVVLFRRREAN